MSDDRIEIQLQDGGNWRVNHISVNNSQRIIKKMQ